jgi:ABC-type cobalamin/Fe3+-siderophores transport system ATPase subunit
MFFFKIKNYNLNISLHKNITKCIAYNAMGKTIVLKILLNQWNKNYYYKNNNNNFYSTSQKKKKLINSKRKIWIFDEPYNALDYYNYIYLKTSIIEHLNKQGKIVYTQNKMNNKNKIFYFYYSSFWI